PIDHAGLCLEEQASRRISIKRKFKMLTFLVELYYSSEVSNLKHSSTCSMPSSLSDNTISTSSPSKTVDPLGVRYLSSLLIMAMIAVFGNSSSIIFLPTG